ncbi:MAG: hypothetical protein GY906_12150 [bacterium]|nr:hypothetical protein [bacterium]
MVDFIKLAATAQRLINANGRSVSIVKHGKTPSDMNKPWRGESTPVIATVTGIASFVPMQQIENNDGVRRGTDYALFAADDDGGNELEDFDVIIDGGVTWQILDAKLINPASKRIMYQFEVKR